MKKNQHLKSIVGLILTMAMLTSMFVGCGGNADKKPSDSEITSPSSTESVVSTDVSNGDAAYENLVASLKTKYLGSETVEYKEAEYKVAYNHVFVIENATAYKDKSKSEIAEDFGVYSDIAQVDDMWAMINYDEGTNSLMLSPPSNNGIRPKYDETLLNFREKTVPDLVPGNEAEDGWGYLDRFYLIENANPETGEKLSIPKVTICSVDRPLSSPKVKLSITEDGFARLDWDKVDGATKYYLCEFAVGGDSISYTTAYIVDEYSDNFIVAPGGDEVNRKQFKLTDPELETYAVTNTNFYDSFITYESTGKDVVYVVVAANGEKLSNMSNLVSQVEVAGRMPYRLTSIYGTDGLNADGDGQDKYAYDNPGILPTYASVDMATRVRAPHLLDYANAKITNTLDGQQIQVTYLEVPVKNTAFHASIAVNVGKEEFEKYLPELVKRQNGADFKSYDYTPQPTIEYESRETRQATNEQTPASSYSSESSQANIDQNNSDLELPNFPVWATSALSEWVAIHMLNNVERIPLKDFNESFNEDNLMGAISEAYRQNPLIGLVDDVSYDGESHELVFKYAFTREEQLKFQNDILTKVKDITPGIIAGANSDLEKHIAINDWIVANAVYDHEALEWMTNANFEGALPRELWSSQNASGVLLEGKGVCASFASAYKLISDEAGLNSVVTVGIAMGNQPHGWNRAELGGQWYTVDPTWNQGAMESGIENPVMNLPDSTASLVYHEESYLMPNAMKNMVGSGNNNEFYVITDRYVQTSEIEQFLNEQFKNKVTNIVFRMDLEIDPEVFETALVNSLTTAVQAGVFNQETFDLAVEAEFMGVVKLKVTY